MAETPDKPIRRKPLKARPQPDLDREALREDIMKRFSETLKYLAR